MIKHKWTIDRIKEVRRLKGEGVKLKAVAQQMGATTSAIAPWWTVNWLAYVYRNRAKEYKKISIPDIMQMMEAEPWLKEFLMSDRLFEPYKENVNGNFRSGVRVVCSKCVAPKCRKHDTMWQTTKNRPNPVHAARHFTNIGWLIGGGPRADVCPECRNYKPLKEVEAEIVSRDIALADPFTPAPYNAPLKEQAPVMKTIMASEPKKGPVTYRDVPKLERRIIADKLDEVYDLKRGGYLDGYNDRKVADDLGCDISLVAAVRDFGFGEETSAEKIEEQIKAMRVEADAVRELKKHVDASIARIEELDRALNERLADYEKASKAWQAKYDTFMNKVVFR